MPTVSRFGNGATRAFGQRGFRPILSDLYFRNVALLLHGDGSNGADNSAFVDNSGNGYTINRYGNTTQGSFSPYSSNWSLYFDGSGDYLYYGGSSAFAFGTGDFTLEFFVYTTSTASQMIYDTIQPGIGGGGSDRFYVYIKSNQTIEVGPYTNLLTTTGTITLGAWNHVAVVRSGTTRTVYINGVSAGTNTLSNNLSSAYATVGFDSASGGSIILDGYLSNLRAVKGTAVYTGAFTPPTAPLAAISGTSLLVCGSNRLVDKSTNNFAVTRTGDVKVSPFGPFAPSTAYESTSGKGSAYFDGSGDYLTLPANDICNFGSGDFTVEFWMYPTAFYNYIIPFATSGSNTDGFFTVAGDSSGSFSAGYYIGGSRPGTSGLTAQLNAWNHVVAQRASGVTSFYLNGVKAATDYTTTYSLPGGDPRIGVNPAAGNERFTGWMSNIKITKGSALYSGSTITVPTSPVTSTGSNRLLLNFTNAGIVDHAERVNFETINGINISTSVKKFGTGSIYFDGADNYMQSADNKADWKWLHGGATDWTIEFWMYLNSTSSQGIICTNVNSVTNAHGLAIGVDTKFVGSFTRGVDGNRMDWSTGNIVSTGSWNHVAIQFNKTTKNVELYYNGTSQSVTNQNIVSNSATGQDGSAFAYSSSDPSYNLNIGRYVGSVSTGSYLNAYLDDLRITRGVRRYTSNFSVPTKVFPDK